MPLALYPRPAVLDPAPRPRFFIEVQHGLCNRLRAMASAAAIADQTGRALVVVWRPDHHCNARMADLFDYDGPVLEEDVDIEACRRSVGTVLSYMEIDPGACHGEVILDDEAPGDPVSGDIWVSSAYTLVSRHCRFKDEQKFLQALVPSAPVLDLLSQVRRPSAVAAHVRMATGPGFDHLPHEAPDNWPAHRHEEILHWRRKSHADAFLARLDQLVADGDAETIFLAADLPETYERFVERYGSRLEMLHREVYDRSAVQLQYALADLIALTQADLLLASTWSSFSDMAQRLARYGRPLERSGYEF